MQSLEPLSYFFGAMLGDGSLFRSKRGSCTVKICCSDTDIVERCFLDVSSYFSDLRTGFRSYYKAQSGKIIQVASWYNKDFYQLLILALGQKEWLPRYIWSASRDSKLDLLAGLMDTDGSINYTGQLTFAGGRRYVYYFPGLCDDLGIRIKSVKLLGSKNLCWYFNLDRQSAIEAGFMFYCSRKRSRFRVFRGKYAISGHQP